MLSQDAMAAVGKYQRPDLFFTLTCNPMWPAIQNALGPGETATDRPDIVARVFAGVLKEIRRDLYHRCYLGKPCCHLHVVEFQKRGLPHAHILLILVPDNKLRLTVNTDIDNTVSAELPDPVTEPHMYDLVTRHMLHGPCGEHNPAAQCMVNGKCSKGFPKKFREETDPNVDGFVQYKRSVARPMTAGYFT